ncbi:hypothetical protein [Legionella tunisiensis]|uniref:hypothetical protein n=1 Tax=Legionella tunisiensis TaxID=1034944 RepID=UPI001E3D6573|nr:hypothetical protein [Legionella tunisiensis]
MFDIKYSPDYVVNQTQEMKQCGLKQLYKHKKYIPQETKNIFLGGNTRIVRFYSKYNWKHYNEGSCDIESVLESGKEAFPEVFKDSSVEFTALKNSVQKKMNYGGS